MVVCIHVLGHVKMLVQVVQEDVKTHALMLVIQHAKEVVMALVKEDVKALVQQVVEAVLIIVSRI